MNDVELRDGLPALVSDQTESPFWMNTMDLFNTDLTISNNSLSFRGSQSKANGPMTPNERIEFGLKEAQCLENQGYQAKEIYSELFWNTKFGQDIENQNSLMKGNPVAFQFMCIKQSCGEATAFFLSGKIYLEDDTTNKVKQNRKVAFEYIKKAFLAGYEAAFETLLHAAEQNSPEANYELHNLYSDGKGRPSDNPNIAFDFLKTAADLGHAKAQLDIAKIFASRRLSQSGSITQDDLADAIKYYEMVAEQHPEHANLGLAELYMNKDTIEDAKTALNYFKAANSKEAKPKLQAFSKVMYEKALVLLSSVSKFNSHENEAKEWLVLAAELGSTDANFELGKIYESRIESSTFFYKEHNENKAFNYFKTAADSQPPHVDSAVKVGRFYTKIGDPDSAKTYYEIAAKKNNIEAKAGLGDKDAAYQHAKTLQNKNANDLEVIFYYDMAANLGNAEAQFELGQLYDLRSKELSIQNMLNNDNKDKALDYYQKAANSSPSHTESALRAGKIHQERGDADSAKLYYEKAGQMGNVEANARLGDPDAAYQYAHSLPPDDPQAIDFYKLAANKGNGDAAFYLYEMHHFLIGKFTFGTDHATEAQFYFEIALEAEHPKAVELYEAREDQIEQIL